MDISINKILEIYNSKLMCTYALYDSRFIKLAVVLKTWNKVVFSDKKKRLNSFTLYLMLIAFLQKESILPNL